MNVHWIQTAHAWLESADSEPPNSDVISAIQSADVAALEQLLEIISATVAQSPRAAARSRILLQLTSGRLKRLLIENPSEGGEIWIEPAVLERLYSLLSESEPLAAAHALQMLSAQGDDESLSALASSLETVAPRDWQATAISLSPMWDAPADRLESLFDLLGDAALNAAVLPVLLDLANHAVRSLRLTQHPWAERGKQFDRLLISTIGQLQKLEKDPTQFGSDVEEIQNALNDGVALAVALADTLGQIKYPAAETLKEALQLSHRRIQTEAACALVRLGDEAGLERMVALASDVAARRRVVAYAEELGIEEKIAEEFRLPNALAESELACWLAEPAQYGLPPTRMELIETKNMYWPSFEEPQACYLFRFTFDLPQGQVTNAGIAGPLTHAFTERIDSLDAEDIFAAFAGWHAEHEDIFEVPAPMLNAAQRREADTIISRIKEQEFSSVELRSLTFLLGELSVLVDAESDGQKKYVVADETELISLPATDGPAAYTPELTLAIYRGRKLLRTFNP